MCPLDIRLRVNAEESRAVGVSGLESNHRTTRPFGRRESHGIGLVDCWPCQVAVTPILNRICRPSVLFLPRGRQQASVDSGVPSGSLCAVGTRTYPSMICRSPPALSDTVVRETSSLVITEIYDFRTTSLRGRTGRLRRTVRNPLRSDRFLPVSKDRLSLKHGYSETRAVLSNVDFSQVTARIHGVNAVVLRLFSV